MTTTFPCGHPRDKAHTFHGRRGWITCVCRVVNRAPVEKGPATTPAPNTPRQCRGCEKMFARRVLRKIKPANADNYYVCMMCTAKGVT